MASIAAIVSIGPKDAAKLRRSGVRTTEALLRRGATRRGRTELAAACELHRGADPGVGQPGRSHEGARASGRSTPTCSKHRASDTVKELGRRNAAALAAKLAQVNEQKKLVRRLPTEAMVERWVEHAGQLDGRVTYEVTILKPRDRRGPSSIAPTGPDAVHPRGGSGGTAPGLGSGELGDQAAVDVPGLGWWPWSSAACGWRVAGSRCPRPPWPPSPPSRGPRRWPS